MKPAGMGRGDEVWHSERSRGDNIMWITDGLRRNGELPEVTVLIPPFCSAYIVVVDLFL